MSGRGGVALALFLLAACGSPQSTPEGSVRSFLDALAESDSAAFADAFTDETRALVTEIETLSAEAQGPNGQALTIEEWCQAFCGGEVVGATLHGDSATVEVRIEETVEAIPLRRVGDRWRIDLASKLTPAVQMLRLAVPEAGGAGADTLP